MASDDVFFPQTILELPESLSEKPDPELPKMWRVAPSMATLTNTPFEYIIPDLLMKDGILMLSGDFGTFKSYLTYFIADAVSKGSEFINRKCQKHPVLILDRENALARVSLRRHQVFGQTPPDNVRILSNFSEISAPELDDKGLLEICRVVRPVIVIDSLTDFRMGKKENVPDEMSDLFRIIHALIRAGAVGVIILHHKPKDGADYRGSTGIPAQLDTAFTVTKKGTTNVQLKAFKVRDGEPIIIEIKLRFTYVPGEKEAIAVDYEVVQSGQTAEYELEHDIEEYVKEHDGCSPEEIRIGIRKGKSIVTEAVHRLLEERKLFDSDASLGGGAGTKRGGRGNKLRLSVIPPDPPVSPHKTVRNPR